MGRNNKQNAAQKAAARGQAVGKAIVPKGTFKRAGDAAGGVLGGALGSSFGLGAPGRAIGAAIGGTLGSGIASILGFGDYTVRANTLAQVGGAVQPGVTVPSFGHMDQGTRVRHREFVRDVSVPAAPTAFSISGEAINPGNKALFPWLSTIADNYQQYKIHGMVLEFRSMSSDITAGGALGVVVLATNYNALDEDYADKLHMENSQYAVSAKPSMSQIHSIECEPDLVANKLLYVRTDANSNTQSQDARLYDLGKFQIATAGLPGSAGEILGELWVSYDIELFKPIMVDSYANSAGVIGDSSQPPTLAKPFGVSPSVDGTVLRMVDDLTLEFTQAGSFLLERYTEGIGLAGYWSFTPSATWFGTNHGVSDSTTEELLVRGITVEAGQQMTWVADTTTSIGNMAIRVAPYDPSFA